MKKREILLDIFHREWGLIFFTTLVPTAAGIILVGVLARSPTAARLTAVVVISLGLLTSVGHLARPARAPFSIRHWKTSWLSREILLAGLFFLFSVVWAAIGWLDNDLAQILGIASLVVAVTLVFAMGRSYQLWAQPAWYGPEVFADLISVFLIAGIPAGELGVIFSEASSWVEWFGVSGLALGLVIYWWAIQHRLRRLEGLLPDRHNARESISHYQRMRNYYNIIISLGVVGLVAAIVAAMANINILCWLVALAAGLSGQLLSRSLFYSLPVHRRYAVPLRGNTMGNR
jgi:DMSO reductase anchor subunit